MFNNRKKFNELYKGLINNEKRLVKEVKIEDVKKGKSFVSYNDGKEYVDLSKHKESCNAYFENYDSKRGYKRIVNMENNKNNMIENIPKNNNSLYNQINLNPRNLKNTSNTNRYIDYNQPNYSKENASINNKIAEHQIQLSDIKLIKYIKPREFFKVKKEGLVDFFVNSDNAIDFDKIVKVNMIEDIIR